MVHVLELEVSRAGGRGEYVVQVVRSPAGEASAAFTLDSDRLLNERASVQNAVLLSSVSSRRAAQSGNEALVQTVGRELFDALLGPKSIASLYAANRALADATQEELRLVLRTESPELAALPWEVMYDAESDAYVCRREPLVRHMPVATVPTPLRVRGALRILGVVSSPRGMAALDVDKEKENLMSALAGPAKRGLIDLQWAPDATWSTLQEVLLSEEWHVIHFIGHGDFDFERDEGILALVGKDGRANRVEGSRFVDLLRQARPMPRLVVLNSCSTATSSSEDLFSGTAAALVRGGVSAVAAMQFEITDDAAVEFCRGFYNAIAHGRGVDEAVGSGRVAILGSSGDTLEWVTPVLYLRGLDARLFAVESAGEAGAVPAVPSTRERMAQPLQALDEHEAATAIPVRDTVSADDPEDSPAQEPRSVGVEEVMREDRAGETEKSAAMDSEHSAPAAMNARERGAAGVVDGERESTTTPLPQHETSSHVADLRTSSGIVDQSGWHCKAVYQRLPGDLSRTELRLDLAQSHRIVYSVGRWTDHVTIDGADVKLSSSKGTRGGEFQPFALQDEGALRTCVLTAKLEWFAGEWSNVMRFLSCTVDGVSLPVEQGELRPILVAPISDVSDSSPGEGRGTNQPHQVLTSLAATMGGTALGDQWKGWVEYELLPGMKGRTVLRLLLDTSHQIIIRTGYFKDGVEVNGREVSVKTALTYTPRRSDPFTLKDGAVQRNCILVTETGRGKEWRNVMRIRSCYVDNIEVGLEQGNPRQVP